MKVKLQMKKDDGVSSVVGEMLLLALVIILVSLFTVSVFGLLPGDRTTVADIVMEKYTPGDIELKFWHKGGDWIDENKLSVTLVTEGGTKYFLDKISLKDCKGESKAVFDLGGCYCVRIPTEVCTGIPVKCSIRLIAGNTVLFQADEVSIQ